MVEDWLVPKGRPLADPFVLLHFLFNASGFLFLEFDQYLGK